MWRGPGWVTVMPQNLNEKIDKSIRRITNSCSGEMRPEPLRSRAWGEEARLWGGESTAGAAAFCRVIYVHTSATKCRNKIGAQSEMNFVDCWLIVLVSPLWCYEMRQRGRWGWRECIFKDISRNKMEESAGVKKKKNRTVNLTGISRISPCVYTSGHACKMAS